MKYENSGYSDELADDVIAALTHYYEISDTLALRFRIEYEMGLDQIESYPFLNREYLPGFRRIVLTPFPYMIVYSVDEIACEIYVLALLHTHADPAVNAETLTNRSIRSRH